MNSWYVEQRIKEVGERQVNLKGILDVMEWLGDKSVEEVWRTVAVKVTHWTKRKSSSMAYLVNKTSHVSTWRVELWPRRRILAFMCWNGEGELGVVLISNEKVERRDLGLHTPAIPMLSIYFKFLIQWLYFLGLLWGDSWLDIFLTFLHHCGTWKYEWRETFYYHPS